MRSPEESAEFRKMLKLQLSSIYGSTCNERELKELRERYLHGQTHVNHAEEVSNDERSN